MKKWILLVEDDLDLLSTVAEGMGEHGFEVVRASNFKEAVLKARNQKFFCIVTDIHIDKVDGRSGTDLVELIRSGLEFKHNRDTPIIVISGHLDKEAAARLRHKVNGGIIKPFTLEQLLQKVRSLPEGA